MSWAGPFPRDASTLVVGRDFLNFWMYGRAAWLPDPSRFYDPHLYNDALAALLGPDYPGQNWSYPPTIMLLAAPFGRIGYVPALLCWTVAGLAIFIAVVRRAVGERHLLIPILCSPAAVFCLISGQSSFLTAAMLLTIMALLDAGLSRRHPHRTADLETAARLAVSSHARGVRPLARLCGRRRHGAALGRHNRRLRTAGLDRLCRKGPAGAESRAYRSGSDRHAASIRRSS